MFYKCTQILVVTPTLVVTFWFVFLQPGRSCRSRSSRSCRSRSWLERPLVAAVEVDLNDPLFYNLDVRDETRWDEMTQHIYCQDIDTFVIWRGMFVHNVECWMFVQSTDIDIFVIWRGMLYHLIVFLSFVTRTFPAGSHLTVTDSRLFFCSFATMIFLHVVSFTAFARLFFLSSTNQVAPTIPSETSSHRKVTEPRNQTGGVLQ